MKPFTSFVLTAALLTASAVSAQPAVDGGDPPSIADALAPLAGELAAYRAEQRVVRVELANGSAITGHIGAIEKTAFNVVSPDRGTVGRRIRYSGVAALRDNVTGERLLQITPLRHGSAGRVKPGFKALIVAGVAVAVLLVVAYFSGAFAA